MTQFDFVVAALLVFSGAVGFARGATREIAALVALILAAALAILGQPLFGPMARESLHPGWLATTVAVGGVFVVAYVALRFIGVAVARKVQQTDFLGALDRSVGLAIGLARGLLLLGALNLGFNAATPPDLRPHWITGAVTWPLSQNMGRLLTALAPHGLNLADQLKANSSRPATDGSRDRTATGGYDAQQRGEIDDLVEKSR